MEAGVEGNSPWEAVRNCCREELKLPSHFCVARIEIESQRPSNASVFAPLFTQLTPLETIYIAIRDERRLLRQMRWKGSEGAEVSSA